jgi:hypothetical protein
VLAGLFASSGAAVALALAPSANALTSSTPNAAHVPSFPVPASATVRPGAAGTTAGGASAPTTTYAPSGSTSLPGTGAAGATTTPAVTPAQPAVTPAQPTTPARPRASAHSAGKVSTEAVVIAALAALLALGCVAWGIARLASFEPRWTHSLRHAMAEAGFRASATWAELSDWVRLGH